MKTSNIEEAGTDADVSLRLTGEKGSSGWVDLDNPGDDFEVDALDTFVLQMKPLGMLDSVELFRNDHESNDSWHPEKVFNYINCEYIRCTELNLYNDWTSSIPPSVFLGIAYSGVYTILRMV